MQAFCELHLKQKTKVRNDRKQGINGVLPFFCQHASLCKTTEALHGSQQSVLLSQQMIQIGHWTACPFVFNNELIIGQPGDTVFVTNLIPRSIERLIEWAPNDNHKEPTGARPNGLVNPVWQPLDNTSGLLFSPGVPPDATKLTMDVYSWPSRKYLIRQKATCEPSLIAWHLSLQRPLQKGPFLFSELFIYRNRDYWALKVNDTHCPTNKEEFKLGPCTDMCPRCACALNGQSLVANDPANDAANITTNDTLIKKTISTSKMRIRSDSNATEALDVTMRDVPLCLSLHEFD
jgi:hypothetical protein